MGSVPSYDRRRLHSGTDDFLISTAAAQISCGGTADVILARVGMMLQERDKTHYLSRSAKAALECILLDEGTLQWMQFAIVRHSLNRRNLTPLTIER